MSVIADHLILRSVRSCSRSEPRERSLAKMMELGATPAKRSSLLPCVSHVDRGSMLQIAWEPGSDPFLVDPQRKQ